MRENATASLWEGHYSRRLPQVAISSMSSSSLLYVGTYTILTNQSSNTHTHTHTCTHMITHKHTRIHTNRHKPTQTHWTHEHTQIHKNTNANTRKHTHTHMHIYTNIHILQLNVRLLILMLNTQTYISKWGHIVEAYSIPEANTECCAELW